MITPIIFAKYIFAVCLNIFGICASAWSNLKCKKITLVPIGIFVFILMQSLFLSTNIYESFERACFSILFVSAFTVMTISTPKLLEFVFFKSIVSIGLIYFFLGYVYLIFFPAESYHVGNFRGFTSNSNYYALFLSVFVWPILLIKFLNMSKKSVVKWFFLLILILTLFLIIETRSRTSLLVIVFISFLIMTTLILKWNLFKTIGRTLRTIASIAVIFLLISNSTLFTNKYDADANSDDIVEMMFSTRMILFEYRIQGISERPWLGWGYSVNSMEGRMQEPWVFNKYEKGSTVLALMEEFGIFFGASLYVVLIWFGILSYRVFKSSPIYSSIVIGSVLHSTFETWLFNFNSFYCWLFWIAVLKILSEYRDLLNANLLTKQEIKSTSKQIFNN